MVDQIRNAAISIDMALDGLPEDHPHQVNPRYSRAPLDQDVANEEAHLTKLEELMNDHKAYQDRLTEVEEETYNAALEPGENLSLVDLMTADPVQLTETATARSLLASFDAINTTVAVDLETVGCQDAAKAGQEVPKKVEFTKET